MSEIWWNLSGTDQQCTSFGGGGHWVHWIQHKQSVLRPGPVVPVTASVDDDGVVILEGDDFYLVGWNHRPPLMREALRRSGGVAQWKPRWWLLVVPTGDLVEGASNVFSVVTADQRRECSPVRRRAPEGAVSVVRLKPIPANRPALRIAARYAAGRPRSRQPRRPLGG